MLTVRTSTHIPTNRHRGSFRFCLASTGARVPRTGVSHLLRERLRLLNAESRRVWIQDQWNGHLGRVQSRQGRRQP